MIFSLANNLIDQLIGESVIVTILKLDFVESMHCLNKNKIKLFRKGNNFYVFSF